MTKLKSIEIIFENCECLTINYPDIPYLHTANITRNIQTWCNTITCTQYIDGFTIGIKKEATLLNSHSLSGEPLNINRLSLLDVTHLILEFEDNTKEELEVEWPEDSIYQSSTGQEFNITKGGNILFTSEYATYKAVLGGEQLDKLCTVSVKI